MAGPVRRRLPMLLLTLLSLVLGGALVVVASAPSGGGGSADGALAAALARAVAKGQATIVDSADQAPLARILGDSSPAAAMDRARGVLDDLATVLGDARGSVVLLDASGRTRLARGGTAGVAPVALPAGDRDLQRVLALRDGAFITTADAGRSVLFAVPVDGARGTAVGVLLAAVPMTALLAREGVSPAGAVALGSAEGSAWSAVAAAGSLTGPLPQPLLLALAALSLLALPLAWWAGRPSRGRRPSPAMQPATTARIAPQVPAAATRPLAFTTTPGTVPVQAPPVAPPPPPFVPAPVPAPSPTAEAAAKQGGRFGRGRRDKDQVAPPSLVDAPVAATATPPDELVDALSGLGNQRGFGEEMDRLMVSWERNRLPFAVLLLDVDDLKITNTRAGHGAGDEQLRTLGRLVKGVLRFSDRAFRIGGDEFAVLLPHTDAAGAVQLGQRLLVKARAGEDGEPAFAFSAGVAAFPGAVRDRDELVAAAGAALAWGKRHGRASVLAHDPVTHAVKTDADRMEKETAVVQVIRDKSLRAVFQPIVDMQTGDVVGFEGLTRPAPGAPFTNPGALFEAAELAGRTVELDAACFETVAEGARAIPADRVVSINLSPRTMEAADFSVAGVLSVLHSHDLDPGRVILELTERETVLDLDRLRDNLSELQRAGVRIAADDVGAGNAGLRLLSQFRFDIVKVDLSLVQEGANNDASRAVLRSLRDLAQRWGAFVIAEGIETPIQLKVVRELGLAAGQGFLIGRPGSIVDLPPVDLVGLEQGQLMLQAAPVPTGHQLTHSSPA